LTQNLVEGCVDFEVAHLSILMVQRLPYPEIPTLIYLCWHCWAQAVTHVPKVFCFTALWVYLPRLWIHIYIHVANQLSTWPVYEQAASLYTSQLVCNPVDLLL